MSRTVLLAAAVVLVGAFGFVVANQPEDRVIVRHTVAGQSPGVVEGSGGGLLAVKSWTPEVDRLVTCENWDRYEGMHRSDLWVDVTAPESGRVLVSFSAMTGQGVEGLYEYWGVTLADETVLAGGRVGASTAQHRVSARFLVELEPGVPTRLFWAHRSDRGGTANLYAGPSYGPAVIEVWTA